MRDGGKLAAMVRDGMHKVEMRQSRQSAQPEQRQEQAEQQPEQFRNQAFASGGRRIAVIYLTPSGGDRLAAWSRPGRRRW